MLEFLLCPYRTLEFLIQVKKLDFAEWIEQFVPADPRRVPL